MSACGPDLVEMTFDRANPEAVKWAKTRSANLIVDVTRNSRAAVRRIMTRALMGELTPREAARLIRSVVGLTERHADAVLNLRAKMRVGGASATSIERAVDRYAAQLLRQRAMTIARTETIAASNEGQRQLWVQAKDAGYLRDDAVRVWITAPERRDRQPPCPICRDLNRTKAEIAGTFHGGISGPPAHPNCRCTTVLGRRDS